MTDASNPPANDLEAQLEALMKQAREGGAASEPEPEPEAADAVAVETAPEPQAEPAAEEPTDLASQLDALMAKVGSDPPTSTDGTAAPAQDVADEQPVDTAAIVDGPDDVEDAFDDLQGAFDAVQDVIAELDDEPDPTPEPVANHAPAAAKETEAEVQGRDDDLAAQLQSLLDEASQEEAERFVSPEELLREDDSAEDDDELEGDFTATVEDVIAEAEAAPENQAKPQTEPEADADANAPPLIDQIDSLLADHADDAISGEFESVDQLLGVSDTSDENVADADDELDDEDDELGGDFQSMDDLLTKPDPAPAKPEPVMPKPDPRREEPAMELDEIDGLFEAPAALSARPAAQAAPADAAPNSADPLDDDDGDAGGFESLDALFSAPPPSVEDRDGSPPAEAATSKAKSESKRKSKAKPSTEAWTLTLNLAVLQAAAVLLMGWTLWACAMVNKPMDKLPSDIKQTVGWVALAIAGPGVLLVVYGLLFN